VTGGWASPWVGSASKLLRRLFLNTLIPDVAMNQACAEVLRVALVEFETDGGPVDGIVDWISDPEEARKRTRIPSAHGVAIFPAASFWPYKFVAHLLQLCISNHELNLQTNTSVTSVSPSSKGWNIETERGSMPASKVVYASNAFTPTILPEFQGKIVPARGQCSAIIPTKAYSGARVFKDIFAWRRGLVSLSGQHGCIVLKLIDRMTTTM
jgi:glycine/D-amino acid oxidase-like deaminating enzyme